MLRKSLHSITWRAAALAFGLVGLLVSRSAWSVDNEFSLWNVDDFRPTPAVVSPIYPSATRQSVSLDGMWEISADPGQKGFAERRFDRDAGSFNERISVPGNWNAQGLGGAGVPVDQGPKWPEFGLRSATIKGSYVGLAWYRRTVDIPSDWRGRHVRLVFGGLLSSVRLWVNGRFVAGRWTDGNSFCIDVTNHIKAGESNWFVMATDEAAKFARESAFPSQDTLLDDAYVPIKRYPADVPPDDDARCPWITYREAINHAFREEMARDDRVVVLGIDVGHHGGPFQTTKDLLKEFGEDRALDTPISEAAIAGAAVGAAAAGLRPVGIIMYGNFMTIATDQIINQAAKMRYMFGGKATLPLVFSSQIGIGAGSAGHHSDCWPEALFSHIPGLLVAAPASPYDAKGLLKAAIREDNPVVFIERKRLYNMKGPVPEGEYVIPFGKARLWRKGSDVTVIAYGSTVFEAMKAADQLVEQGISVEVIDPRTLVPLDKEAILASVNKTGRVVIAHEAPLRCGFGAEIAATISEEALDALDAPIARLGGKDAPIPYSKPLEAAMAPVSDDIAAAINRVLERTQEKIIGMAGGI